MNNGQNATIDPNLILSMSLTEQERAASGPLSTGYNETTKTWRLIVKYSGDITAAVTKYNGFAEILTEKYAVVTLLETSIPQFANEPEVDYIEKPESLFFQLDKSTRDACITPVNDYEPYLLKGDGVLIGIIDSGINYRHPDFLNPDGTTRLISIWDQMVDGNPPAGFQSGTEYTREQINAALQSATEEERMQLVPHEDYLGHGTHVTSIAAGAASQGSPLRQGVAPHAQIITVRLGLPDADAYPINTIDIMFAIKYLLNKARELNMPIAINISYGYGMGGHDGSSLFEQYIDEMSLYFKNVIVVACGNEAARGCHIHGNIRTMDAVEFIIYDGTRSATLELWKFHTDFFHIEIISPAGISTGVIREQNQQIRHSIEHTTVCVYFSNSSPFTTKESIHIEIISSRMPLRAGTWTIRFAPITLLNGNFDIWMFCRGLSACRFMSPTPLNTITMPATAQSVISVAGYDYLTGKISPFSGEGSPSMPYQKPDLAAPCVDIFAASSTGAYINMTGTSMAAPFVTGASALLMEWGIVRGNDPHLYGQKVKAYLCSGAKRERNVVYPNVLWGYGKLCLWNSLELLSGGQIYE